jgi:hypothetical protein
MSRLTDRQFNVALSVVMGIAFLIVGSIAHNVVFVVCGIGWELSAVVLMVRNRRRQ